MFKRAETLTPPALFDSYISKDINHCLAKLEVAKREHKLISDTPDAVDVSKIVDLCTLASRVVIAAAVVLVIEMVVIKGKRKRNKRMTQIVRTVRVHRGNRQTTLYYLNYRQPDRAGVVRRR